MLWIGSPAAGTSTASQMPSASGEPSPTAAASRRSRPGADRVPGTPHPSFGRVPGPSDGYPSLRLGTRPGPGAGYPLAGTGRRVPACGWGGVGAGWGRGATSSSGTPGTAAAKRLAAWVSSDVEPAVIDATTGPERTAAIASPRLSSSTAA